jgi:hypothetical protein
MKVQQKMKKEKQKGGEREGKEGGLERHLRDAVRKNATEALQRHRLTDCGQVGGGWLD